MRAKERGAGEVTAYIQRGSPDVIRFAAFHGFVRVGYSREFLRMAHLPLGPEGMRSKRATFPEGWTVQSYTELRNPQKVVEAYQRSFGDLWGHNPTTLEGQAPWLERIDPDGLFLLFNESGNLAGNVMATRSSGSEPHQLDAPGVAPEHRCAELYAELANLALEWVQNLAQRDVVLESWGDSDEVIAVCAALGFMEISRSSYVWRRV